MPGVILGTVYGMTTSSDGDLFTCYIKLRTEESMLMRRR